MQQMKFGIFLAPFHDHATNPNANLHRDLELIRQLDYLGFDEAWIGEHHSCGMEIIADPMIFAATALQHTRSIKLGTGVLSVPYPNPLWTADRIILLDHLGRGRFMFGAGPGALPTDAHMIGLHPSELRRMLEEGLEAITHLLRSDEPLTMTTDWFELVDAKCQLPLYSDIDITVAASVSPSGPRLAGRYGIGLLSVGATLQSGSGVLALHYDVWRDVAAEHGHTADRDTWRLVGAMHVAETREQALRDVEYGIEQWFDYMQHTAAAPSSLQRATRCRSGSPGSTRPGSGLSALPRTASSRSSRCGTSRVASAGICAWTMTSPTPPRKPVATNSSPSE